MTLLRNVLTDLVDKKLWPVAVALLAALVAVPLVLAGGGSDEQPLPVAGAVSGEAGPAIAVTQADEPNGPGVKRSANDPFRKRPGTQTADETAAPAATLGGGLAAGGQAGAPAASGGGTPASGGSDASTVSIPGLDDVGVVPVGGGTGSSGSTGAKKPAADATDSWHVDLRFGKNGSLSTRNDVPRLSPLPSASDPFFVFLGVAADGKTAIFLVSSDAEATGDGKCVPSTANCDRVEMQAGDTEFFDVATPEGEVVQYQLDIVKISREKSANAAVAQSARVRESSAGRKVLRAAVDTKQVDVSDLAYSADLGLVVPSGTDTSGALFGGFRVDLRFGAPGALVKRYNLARLTPLPSVDEPSLVYLGVLEDGKTAIFLNPSEAHTSGGQAVCEPSPEQCQRVKLGEGQSATFDAPTLDGGTTQYQLDIDGITPLEAATAEAAEASRKRESPAGRVILRRLVHEVGGLVQDLTFSGGKGVVEVGPTQP